MFRATCFAQLKNRVTEQPHIRMFASDDDAVKWIDQQARQRGFVEYALTRRNEDTPKGTMERGFIADPKTGRNVAVIRSGEVFRDDAAQAKVAIVRDGVLYDLENKFLGYLAELSPGAAGSPAFENLLASKP